MLNSKEAALRDDPELEDFQNIIPDDVPADEEEYRRYVIAKVERGLADIAAGRFVSEEEAKRRIAEWTKSYGQRQDSSMSRIP